MPQTGAMNTASPPLDHMREFAKYFAASLVALGVDFALLLFLAQFIHYTIAATVAFLIGSLVHYRLAIRFVFRRRKIANQRSAETLIFVGAGTIGLIINLAVISACVEWFALSLPVSKLIAAGASFFFGYISRKLALF